MKANRLLYHLFFLAIIRPTFPGDLSRILVALDIDVRSRESTPVCLKLPLNRCIDAGPNAIGVFLHDRIYLHFTASRTTSDHIIMNSIPFMIS